ncbi:uncharacterized [Tachysurus ichikawai]
MRTGHCAAGSGGGVFVGGSSSDSVRVLHSRVTLPAFYPVQQKRLVPSSATSDQDLAAIVQVPLTRLTVCFSFKDGIEVKQQTVRVLVHQRASRGQCGVLIADSCCS